MLTLLIRYEHTCIISLQFKQEIGAEISLVWLDTGDPQEWQPLLWFLWHTSERQSRGRLVYC